MNRRVGLRHELRRLLRGADSNAMAERFALPVPNVFDE